MHKHKVQSGGWDKSSRYFCLKAHMSLQNSEEAIASNGYAPSWRLKSILIGEYPMQIELRVWVDKYIAPLPI